MCRIPAAKITGDTDQQTPAFIFEKSPGPVQAIDNACKSPQLNRRSLKFKGYFWGNAPDSGKMRVREIQMQVSAKGQALNIERSVLIGKYFFA